LPSHPHVGGQPSPGNQETTEADSQRMQRPSRIAFTGTNRSATLSNTPKTDVPSQISRLSPGTPHHPPNKHFQLHRQTDVDRRGARTASIRQYKQHEPTTPSTYFPKPKPTSNPNTSSPPPSQTTPQLIRSQSRTIHGPWLRHSPSLPLRARPDTDCQRGG
jgi:hypothetical protein